MGLSRTAWQGRSAASRWGRSLARTTRRRELIPAVTRKVGPSPVEPAPTRLSTLPVQMPRKKLAGEIANLGELRAGLDQFGDGFSTTTDMLRRRYFMSDGPIIAVNHIGYVVSDLDLPGRFFEEA